jgi:predicted TIM-barrel fold metal-dependent hydrolase
MSLATDTPRAARIREQLGYPIVDGDGHILELTTVFLEYLRETEGTAIADRFEASGPYARWSEPWAKGLEQRRRTWTGAANLWGWPTLNTLDRATATLPRLYAARMDDLGIDYSILYPSAGLFLVNLAEEDLRDAVVRAYNRWVIELCATRHDRLCPVATIAMHTPEEAVRQLRDAAQQGHKVVCMQGFVPRAVPAVAERAGDDVAALAPRLDYFGLDSDYDYDPVWAACAELRLAPTFHSGSGLWPGRSVSNYTYNHIGSIAQAQEGLAKALFMGGVTRRFPTLNFGFLECGAAWACSLLSDVVGHFHKRSLEGMAYVDPAKLDLEGLMGLIAEHGDEFTVRHLDRARAFYDRPFPPLPERDDFWEVHPRDAAEIVELFVPRFYIGCEADDPSVAWAFNTKVNPGHAKVRAMFGSDVGHWDVTDVGDVVVEAWELVEDGLITEDDFREFVFWNPVELHARTNPDFFKGTRVERDVDAFLASGRSPD